MGYQQVNIIFKKLCLIERSNCFNQNVQLACLKDQTHMLLEVNLLMSLSVTSPVCIIHAVRSALYKENTNKKQIKRQEQNLGIHELLYKTEVNNPMLQKGKHSWSFKGLTEQIKYLLNTFKCYKTKHKKCFHLMLT